MLSVVFGASSGLQPERAPIQSKELKPGQTSPQTRSGEFQEDLNSIDVKDSKFPPVQVTLLERTEGKNAVYFSEHLRVTFRPGDPQDLYVILPAALKNPPVVLYIYSYPETVARFQMEQWALSAVAQGYAAIGFSSGIMGDATNHDLSREKFLIQFPQNLLRAAHDIQLVLNYLATRGDLNLAAVGMYAAGSGGSAGILASAADSRIKVLDVFGPWGAWPEFFANSSIIPLGKRDTFLKPEYLQSLAKFDPVAWFPKCRARSVRIQDVRQQDLVPGGAQQKIEDAAPDFAEVNQFEDSRVLLEMQGAGRVFGWTQAQLRPDAKPQTVAEKSKRIHYYAGKGHTIAE
ncbi:MAG TPA: hypothetical protein VJX70_09085 [Candidatus Acidoferrum sp.]|nr:hypothetical protein [Candidatus Acidoferrum sp.]